MLLCMAGLGKSSEEQFTQGRRESSTIEAITTNPSSLHSLLLVPTWDLQTNELPFHLNNIMNNNLSNLHFFFLFRIYIYIYFF